MVDRYRFICRDVEPVLTECPSLAVRVQSLTASQLLATRSMCERLARMAVIEASIEDVEMLALQIVLPR